MQETTKRRDVNAVRKCFWTRLERLLKDRGCKTLDKQSKFLQVSKSTLMNWKKWSCSPDLPKLIQIARSLDCSVDYLIDRSVKVQTASADIQTAVKTTGLSEKAVNALRACQECGANELLNTINALIVSDIAVCPESVEAGFPVSIGRTGSVQGSGLIGALHQNMISAIAYDAAKANQDKISSDALPPEELRKFFEQKQKVHTARTSFENTGYKMMLICTTATAEGEKYHELLRQNYAKNQCINDQNL